MAKMGRPTDYSEEMPLKLYKAMTEGKSVIRFCRDVGIASSTFYLWVEKHLEFSSAFDLGKNNCEAYWEDWLVTNFENKNVNSTLVKLFFANRFGWQDKTESKKDHNEDEKETISALKDLLIKCLKEI